MTCSGRIEAVIAQFVACGSRLAMGLRPMCACTLGLILSACFWGDRGYPPTSAPGHVPSPPKYVRILEWIRPDMFRAEFQDGQGRHDAAYFMIVTRKQSDYPLGDGWYAPARTRSNPLPALNESEKVQLAAIEQKCPPRTVVELDYPLLHDKSKIGTDWDVEVSRSDVRTSSSWHGAYIITIKAVTGNDVLPPRE